ncbi:hypothetical protein LCGC14_1274440 [marine sediment metagenome]|uniref:NAD-dependent epimerase/dehydratase domain-containing protein n=1 Tax=marine sediment metagenome TaxID=412755 RepID=A0A0F9LIA4_9ZZZZ
MYGEYDCFDLEDCHVIPALMLKMYQSKLNGSPVVVWGSGQSIRDFVYVKDVAECLPFFLEHNYEGPINLSSGKGASIKELVTQMAKIIKGDLKIIWDDKMPEGPPCKVFDVSKMNSLGLSCSTSLAEGLQKTYDWFLLNKA